MHKEKDFDIYNSQLQFRTDSRSKDSIIQTRLLKLSSKLSKTVYKTIGIALFDSEQFQKSLAPLKKAITINPYNSRIQISFATALFKLEKQNEAFRSIKKALSLSPGASNLQNFLINSLKTRNRLQDVDAFCQEITNSITKKEVVSLFYYEIAEALVKNNQHSQALGSYKKAIEMSNKEVSHHHYQYAMALYHEGLFEEAIVQFEHVKRLAPNDKRACNNIAFMYYCHGKVEKALEEYESLIKNGLVEFATYSNLVLVLHQLDKDQEVINLYKELFVPYIPANQALLNMIYNEELRQVQLKLEGDDIDEETRGFYEKKLKGINLILSLLN